MSLRPKTDNDQLDFYLGFYLKNFAAHAPLPRDGKRRLLRAATISNSFTVKQAISLFSVLRAIGRIIEMFLVFIDKNLVVGPLPLDDEIALMYTRSLRAHAEFTMQSVSHLRPTAIGCFYFS
jgi:hypothetical protein